MIKLILGLTIIILIIIYILWCKNMKHIIIIYDKNSYHLARNIKRTLYHYLVSLVYLSYSYNVDNQVVIIDLISNDNLNHIIKYLDYGLTVITMNKYIPEDIINKYPTLIKQITSIDEIKSLL